MRRSLLLSLLALPAFAAEGEPTPDQKPRLAVVPFTSLSPDVPMRAGPKAAGMLAQEFKSADAFVLLDSQKDKVADPHEADLTEARRLVEEARALRAKKKFRLAEEALLKALGVFRNADAAVSEPAIVGEVQDAWVLLAAVQFNTGRDDEGHKSLTAGLTLAPDRELPLAQTSALFSRVVTEDRKALKELKRSSLLIQSLPAGAPITLDGVTLGATPLQVRDVPPGQHFWRAQLSNGEVVANVVEVGVGKEQVVNVASTAKDPESRLLGALSQNKLDAEALAAAKEHAKELGADLLLLGALSRDGKGLALDAFLVVAATGEVRRLARPQFDPELLSAGMEFFNLAGDMAKKGALAGEPQKVPAAVSTMPITLDAKVKDARYGVAPEKENLAEGLEATEGGASAKDPGKDEPRKPVGPPARRVPLKKK